MTLKEAFGSKIFKFFKKEGLTVITNEEFKKMVPLEFIEWYSGMDKQKILNAIERWHKEKA